MATRRRKVARSVTLPNQRRVFGLARRWLPRILHVVGEVAPVHAVRPRVRGDCIDSPRPCPWVGCRYHLYCDVDHRGSLKVNWPDLEPHECPETCALDVADRGEHILDFVGQCLNVSRERVRQLQDRALVMFELAAPARLRALLEE